MTNLKNDSLAEDVLTAIAESTGIPIQRVRPEFTIGQEIKFYDLTDVHLIRDLEREFGVNISKEDAWRLNTIQDIMDLIRRLKQ